MVEDVGWPRGRIHATTGLRSVLIEAGAVKLYELDGGRPEIWDNIGDELRRAYREKSAAVVDRVLDALADRADEWAAAIAAPKSEWDDSEAYDSMIRAMSKRDRRLIAVLRGDT